MVLPAARTSPGPRTLLCRGACALVFGVWLAGCATVQHSLELSKYAGRTLSTRGGEGAQCLASEIEVDVTVRDWVSANGRPDYVHVEDRMGVYFFYVKADRAVKFERELIPPSVARDLGRIPGSLLDMLPRREVQAIVARRQTAKREDAARQARQWRNTRRAAPASPAPGGGYVARGFDVKQIIARLRPPLTAADPGVSGWRRVRYADGQIGSTASLGSTRYEVRPDRLAVALAMPSGRRTPPAAARLEVLRLNGSIFGAHAKAVTEHAMKLVERVAADRSGRTPMAQRIRGRLVRVDRIPGSGLLVYSIRP